jgi:hypothetical protein
MEWSTPLEPCELLLGGPASPVRLRVRLPFTAMGASFVGRGSNEPIQNCVVRQSPYLDPSSTIPSPSARHLLAAARPAANSISLQSAISLPPTFLRGRVLPLLTGLFLCISFPFNESVAVGPIPLFAASIQRTRPKVRTTVASVGPHRCLLFSFVASILERIFRWLRMLASCRHRLVSRVSVKPALAAPSGGRVHGARAGHGDEDGRPPAAAARRLATVVPSRRCVSLARVPAGTDETESPVVAASHVPGPSSIPRTCTRGKRDESLRTGETTCRSRMTSVLARVPWHRVVRILDLDVAGTGGG